MMKIYIPDEKLISLVGLEKSDKVNIFIADRRSFLSNGRTWPNLAAKVRYFYIKEIRQAKGYIVIIEKRKRGVFRSDAEIRSTLIHELVHVSQYYHKQGLVFFAVVVSYGLSIIIGLMAAILLREKLAIIFGVFIGYQMGYLLSPIELEARRLTKKLSKSR